MIHEVCIVTAYDEKYLKMARFCVDSIGRYASTHKLASCIGRIGREPGLSSGRPAAWEKIPAILEVFRAGYPWVLWIDADAAFVRSDVDIRHEIGDKDLYLVIGEHVEPRPGGVVHRCDQPCTGFMLVRNCDWAEQFLREMWERREFTNHCWWELAAFINLAGVDRQYDEKMQDLGIKQLIALAEPSRNPRAAEEIAAHVGRLDMRWNCTDQSLASVALDPIVRHYTGGNGPFNTRLALADRDYFRIFNRHL